MASLAPAEGLRRATGYTHAVVSWIGTDGYPVSVAGDFDIELNRVRVGPLAPDVVPAAGQEVCVTFSHIRPRPGQGYDKRRYVNLWGTTTVSGSRVDVEVSSAWGWDEEETPFFELAERSVPVAERYFTAVGARPRLSRWWTFFRATRLPFVTATVVPVALGGAVAAAHDRFAWGWFLLALLAAMSLHLGLNMANDVFDDASGADRANVTPTPFSGGSRMIQYGLVSRRAMVTAAVACHVLGVGVGLWLAAARGGWLLVIGLIGLAISVAYSAPPFRLSHRGLGEAATAIGFGPVMVLGAYFVCAQRWSWEALYASLPVALLIGLVLFANEVPDRAGDAAAGKRTLAVRWPQARVVRVYGVAAVAAFALVVVGVAVGVLPVWTLAAVLPAPMALRVWRGLDRHYEKPYELMPFLQTGIGLHLAVGLLLVLGYVVEAVT